MVNIIEIKNEIFDFIKTDKSDGIKHAWYNTIIETGKINVYDTLIGFECTVLLYKSQGILMHNTIPLNNDILKIIGAKSGKIIVFKSSTSMVLTNEGYLDNVGMAFDYHGHEDEQVIVEIKF